MEFAFRLKIFRKMRSRCLAALLPDTCQTSKSEGTRETKWGHFSSIIFRDETPSAVSRRR